MARTPVGAGPLRHLVEIQRFTETGRNVAGEAVGSWATITNGRRWAYIAPLSAREWFESRAENAEATHLVRIRQMDGITIRMRVLFGTRTFEVVSLVDIEERGKYLHLLCTEVI